MAGLVLAGLTSFLVAALHVGSNRLLAGFDTLSGDPHARAPEEFADLSKLALTRNSVNLSSPCLDVE